MNIFKMSGRFLTILFTIVVCFDSLSQEICNNNRDDDGDGLIDLYDRQDCPCFANPPSDFSLIPNPSFEDVNCIPEGYSELDCAEGWSQATMATSDLLSTNGFMPSFIPTPLPDGDNCAGVIVFVDYLEYLGACLTEPMVADSSYSLMFDIVSHPIDNCDPADLPPIDLTLFGLKECTAFPLNTAICPESFGWVELGVVSYAPELAWQTVNIKFKPDTEINTIMLGGPCDVPDAYFCMMYFGLDNLRLNTAVEEIVYHVPNSFTPNGDEFNQTFKPEFVCGFDVMDYRFEVYNRWGEMIFQSYDAAVGWDGTYKGAPASQGVYSWQVVYKSEMNSGKNILSGHVNLLH